MDREVSPPALLCTRLYGILWQEGVVFRVSCASPLGSEGGWWRLPPGAGFLPPVKLPPTFIASQELLASSGLVLGMRTKLGRLSGLGEGACPGDPIVWTVRRKRGTGGAGVAGLGRVWTGNPGRPDAARRNSMKHRLAFLLLLLVVILTMACVGAAHGTGGTWTPGPSCYQNPPS